MKLYEVDSTESDIALLFRNIIAQANSKNQSSYLSWAALTNLQQNVNAPQFSYDTFKELYDASPLIQNLIKDFDDHGIELKTKKSTPEKQGKEEVSTVSQMAKSATNRRRG
jgi:hypothetical protein